MWMARRLRRGIDRVLKARGTTCGGFTLLEVLIALAFLSVALLTLAQMSIVAIRGNAAGAKMTQAVTMAQDKIEQLKNFTYTQLLATANGNDAAGAIARTWTITTPSPGLAQIQVITTWTDMNGKQKTVRLTTEVSE